MKTYISLTLSLLLVVCGSSCGVKTNNNSPSGVSSAYPFSPVLDEQIKNFILFNNNKGSKAKVYNLTFFNKDGNCYISIGHDFFYNKKSVKRYFIIDDCLITGDYSDSLCAKDIIDIDKMLIFKDSIPNYTDISKSSIDYDTKNRIFKIINSDSLEMISIGW